VKENPLVNQELGNFPQDICICDAIPRIVKPRRIEYLHLAAAISIVHNIVLDVVGFRLDIVSDDNAFVPGEELIELQRKLMRFQLV